MSNLPSYLGHLLRCSDWHPTGTRHYRDYRNLTIREELLANSSNIKTCFFSSPLPPAPSSPKLSKSKDFIISITIVVVSLDCISEHRKLSRSPKRIWSFHYLQIWSLKRESLWARSPSTFGEYWRVLGSWEILVRSGEAQGLKGKMLTNCRIPPLHSKTPNRTAPKSQARDVNPHYFPEQGWHHHLANQKDLDFKSNVQCNSKSNYNPHLPYTGCGLQLVPVFPLS